MLRFCVSLSVLSLFCKFIGIIYKFVNSLLELRPSSGGVSAKRKWFYTGFGSADKFVKMKQSYQGGGEASQSIQPVEEPHTTSTASDTTRDTDHEEAEDLADVPEVSATTSSELPTENPSSEENTLSGEKRGK